MANNNKPHQTINSIECKHCSKCLQYKPLECFTKNKYNVDGLYGRCKECKNGSRRTQPTYPPNKIINGIIYRLCSCCKEEKDILLFYRNDRICKKCKYAKNKQRTNKDERKEYMKQYRINNKEKLREKRKIYEQEHEEQRSAYMKEYRKTHVNECKEYDRRKRERNRNDVEHRITRNLRRRLLLALKGNPKATTTFNLIGCDIATFRQHLEQQFQEGMTWDNYGKWHIDHIIPCAAFDMTNEEQQKKCFHYINMQPLWKEDNLKKGSKH